MTPLHLIVEEGLIIMLLGQLHNIVVWIIGLNQDLTLETSPPRTTGHLGQELEGLLPCSEIR